MHPTHSLNKETVSEKLKRAREARKSGHLDKAISYYKQVLSLDANQVKVLRDLGDVYFMQKQYRQAKECYVKLVQLNPDLSPAHFKLGRIADIEANHEEATTYYQHAHHLAPTDFKPSQALGDMAFVRKDFTQAKTYYDRAIELGSPASGLRFRLGRIAHTQKAYAAAIAHFKSAIDLKPNNPNYHLALGNAYIENNQLTEAENSYTSALEIDASLLAGHFKLGQVAKLRGDQDVARSHYKRALSLNPKHKPSQKALNALDNQTELSSTPIESIKTQDTSPPRTSVAALESARLQAPMETENRSQPQPSQASPSDVTLDTLDNNLQPPEDAQQKSTGKLTHEPQRTTEPSSGYKITPSDTDETETEPHPNGFVEKIWQRLFR